MCPSVYISIPCYLPIFSNSVYSYMGIGIIISGIVIRFAAIISLGRFSTVNATIRKGHTLSKDGLYKYFRHPSYSASLLSFIGFGISVNNWLSVTAIAAAIIIAFSIRVTAYKKTTSRFIPFIH